MNDNNNFDDVEFIDINDTEKGAGNTPPVSEYTNYSDPDAPVELSDLPVKRHKSSSKSRAARRRRRRRRLLIRRCIFAAFVLVFFVSATALVVNLLSYSKGDKIYKNVENSVFSLDTGSSTPQGSQTPSQSSSQGTAESVILTNYDHSALLALNADAIGYIQIPAIDILLPVVHGSDNEYYLTHTLTGETSKNGTLFMDSRDSAGIDSQNMIIYGHNMKNGSMFGALKKFINKDFFNEGNNKYFYFYVGDVIYQYEIYSVHTTPASNDGTYTYYFENSDAFLNYLNTCAKASYHASDVTFSADSKTITMSTCTNDDKTRLVVQAVRTGTVAH